MRCSSDAATFIPKSFAKNRSCAGVPRAMVSDLVGFGRQSLLRSHFCAACMQVSTTLLSTTAYLVLTAVVELRALCHQHIDDDVDCNP